MKTLSILCLAIVSVAMAGRGFAAVAPAPVQSRHPAAAETYTITSTLQLVQPFRIEDMTDDFQDARLISTDGDSATVEITTYPLYRPTIGANPRWREEDATMTEYLRPTPTENWDEAMRRDLLAELRAAGIEPDQLTDRELVEKVSRWAMRRAKSTQAFAVWTIHFPQGKPEIFPALRGAFDKERRDPKWTDEQMIGQEVLGRSMFYDKVHGSCTSSSIYLTTIFRALGIPTRIVFCIPPFDANDPKQAKLFYDAIHHHQVRETVRTALDGMRGFSNHLFNEVYIDHHWVRLNYSTLGQPILDAHYFGLLTHIYTTSDLSQVPLAETWGMRYFHYPADQARLSSSNPYRLIAVSDRFDAAGRVDNPAVAAPPELTAVTVVALLTPDAPEMPSFVTDGWKPEQKRPDFLLSFREWMPTDYKQMRVFRTHASQDFLLRAEGHPELKARLAGGQWSRGDGSFQAYGVAVAEKDRGKIARGVAYTLVPLNISETYYWKVPADLPPVMLQP